MFIYDTPEWPNFKWNPDDVYPIFARVIRLLGALYGRMNVLDVDASTTASFQTLTQDVIKSSEIEGEKLDFGKVQSSLARHLGLNIGAAPHSERSVDGIVEVMLDANQNYSLELTEKRLFGWHSAMFPNRMSGMWRTDELGPMLVVSGPYGKEKIYYKAPGSDRVPDEMRRFLKWFNAPTKNDLIIKAAIAHLWFVTIHPFDDGNGRIARAITDMMLARADSTKQRFYSMSAQILREREAYYEILQQTQSGSVDITAWMVWFLLCLKRSITASSETLQIVLDKADFWKRLRDQALNDRQRKVINLLLDGFEGKLTSSKWSKLTKCSQDTALRDINDLLDRKILVKENAGGRSTSYKIVMPGE